MQAEQHRRGNARDERPAVKRPPTGQHRRLFGPLEELLEPVRLVVLKPGLEFESFPERPQVSQLVDRDLPLGYHVGSRRRQQPSPQCPAPHSRSYGPEQREEGARP